MSTSFLAFARRFLVAFGASWEERDGRVHAQLPQNLAEHFGRPQVVWSFTPHDKVGELVAYGSRAFEDMQAYLGSHGRQAAVRLPVKDGASYAVPRAIAGSLELMEETEASTHAHVFNFQLAFTSDERVERLFGVCLEGSGKERPELLGVLDEAEALGLGLDLPAGSASLLPPSSELQHAAEGRAIAAAEAWASPMEQAALGRLEALGSRLVAYYEAQMGEVQVRKRRGQEEEAAVTEADELRWALRRELERKLRDETARHQLRIQVRRISLMQIEQPGRRRRYRLETALGARELVVGDDLHLGTTAMPPCERCGEAHGCYGLCAEGHLACPGCLGGCARCGQAACHAELGGCGSCGLQACPRCLGRCARGHEGCRTHLFACPGCGLTLCPQCARPHSCGADPG